MVVTPLHTRHPRRFEENRFVYPVLSRRSEGISVGVNLNPDKVCNFDCIYCQVDRTTQSETTFVETQQLLVELEETLRLGPSGELFEHPQLEDTPPQLRRLNDIAFSGDGEPTTYRNFDEIIAACAEVKREAELRIADCGLRFDLASAARPNLPSQSKSPIKLILITNASMFHRPHVQRG